MKWGENRDHEKAKKGSVLDAHVATKASQKEEERSRGERGEKYQKPGERETL